MHAFGSKLGHKQQDIQLKTDYEGFAEVHLPCPCGESTDAYCKNYDGSGKCFSCNKFYPSSTKGLYVEPEIEEYIADTDVDDVVTMEYLSHFGVSKKTFEFFEAPTKVVNGVPVSIGFPYEIPDGTVYKIRTPDKKFAWSDKGVARHATLCGKQFFPRGSRDQIVIVEGEKDMVAAYEMLTASHQNAAVVSVANGASSAFSNVKAERDYLLTFGKIVLCLDNDKAGLEAMDKIVRSGIFDYNILFKAW